MKDIFDPVELAFLADWFDVERPQGATDIDLDKYMDREAVGIIYPRKIGYAGYDHINNAVARLCLNPVQGKLPQWSATNPAGEQIFGRHYEEPIHRSVQWLPHLLLEINWADSGPGYSWPESWFVTTLPVFDRCVVTASVDSSDCWGVTDIALGHFAPVENTVDASLRIIEEYWRRDYGHRDEPFECILETGMISTHMAWKLAAVSRLSKRSMSST